MTAERKRRIIAAWVARATVLATFVGNMWCVATFLVSPDVYASAYELSGVPGRVAIQGIAVAFLMWNVTYPLVIISPVRFRTLYAIVLVQQLVGLIGEFYILSQIGAGHELLSSNILRFIAFDGLGLILMGAAYIILLVSLRKDKKARH